ncbi:MAG: hypothetical protein ACKO24_10560, partial [Leptolyngbyaceae cyanobacterium]
MKIDDEKQAKILVKLLKKTVPFKVRGGKEFLRLLHDQGKVVSPNQEFEVTFTDYSGDVGGIVCGILVDENDQQVFVTSLTHLKIDSSHPLAAEVKAYQQKRIRGLKLQDSKSGIAELMAMGGLPKKKGGKGGFGR